MTIPAVNSARVDAYRTLAFGSIGGSYTALGGPTTHLMSIMHFVNTTNADVSVSFDGTTDNIYVPASSFFLYDLRCNQLTLTLNTQVYVKTAGSPSSGAVYLMFTYAKGS